MSGEQVDYCKKRGELRHSEAERLGAVDRHLETVRRYDTEPHDTGAIVEGAVCLYLREPLDLTVNAWTLADVRSDIEARGSRRGDACLIVRKRDEERHKLRRKFVLGIVPRIDVDDVPVYLMGWSYGYEAAQNKYWRNRNGKEWAWFMPVSDLTPMSYLPTHKVEPGDEYDLWPSMAKAGYDRLTKANIEAFKKGLKP